MGKQVMERKAADNKYLHKDFHKHLNLGIEYLRQQYGEDSVREYLKQFAISYYTPLKAAIKEMGLAPLLEHNKEIYLLEEAPEDMEFTLTKDELVIRVKKCPGVTYIIKSGIQVSPLYFELTRTVNETICEGTPFSFELLEYDPCTGASVQRYYRKVE